MSKFLYIEIFNNEVLIEAFGPCLCWRRVADSECRLQLGTGVTEHRLQCKQFIATQFLAQALKSTYKSQVCCSRHDGVAGEAEAKEA